MTKYVLKLIEQFICIKQNNPISARTISKGVFIKKDEAFHLLRTVLFKQSNNFTCQSSIQHVMSIPWPYRFNWSVLRKIRFCNQFGKASELQLLDKLAVEHFLIHMFCTFCLISQAAEYFPLIILQQQWILEVIF